VKETAITAARGSRGFDRTARRAVEQYPLFSG
jgi:hypothetical protein